MCALVLFLGSSALTNQNIGFLPNGKQRSHISSHWSVGRHKVCVCTFKENYMISICVAIHVVFKHRNKSDLSLLKLWQRVACICISKENYIICICVGISREINQT